jgi:hypothetical protein
MKKSTITKTINKLNSNLENELGKVSLGFKRLSVLPKRIRRSLDLAIYLENGNTNTHDAKVSFFENMSESEYLKYLKIA